MARTKVRCAKLTLPRRCNAMARDWLFGKLDAVRDEHPATCVMAPPDAARTTCCRELAQRLLRVTEMKSAERTITMERNLAAEEAELAEIIRRILAVQASTAAEENRPLRRAAHAKGVCARAVCSSGHASTS